MAETPEQEGNRRLQEARKMTIHGTGWFTLGCYVLLVSEKLANPKSAVASYPFFITLFPMSRPHVV